MSRYWKLSHRESLRTEVTVKSTKLEMKCLPLLKMYLARIYIPSNSRLELWRRSRPVGLSVLVKLRDARRGVAEPASVDLTFINGR